MATGVDGMSVLPTVAAGLVLAVVLARAAVVDRERALLLWALAAAAYSLRVAAETLQPAWPPLFSFAVASALGVASALLLLAGVLRFTGHVPSVGSFFAAGLLATGGSIALRAAGVDPVLAATPSFVAQGVARIAAGVAWFRRRRPASWSAFVAGVLVVWGLHALDYPLIAGDPLLARIGYEAGALLANLAAVGIVLAYFDEIRGRLALSEARYRSLFQDSASAMLLIDPADGSIKDANKAAERFYGWSRDELTRMRISDINTLSPDEVKAEMERAQTLQKNHFEFKHRLASGEVRDVEVYSGPVVGEGGQAWLYSIVHDVTERVAAQRALEESERRYRAIFEESEQPMLLVDPDGARIVDANAAAAALYGWSEAELESMSIADLSAHDGLDVVLSEVDKALHQGQHFGAYQHRVASGGIRDVEIYATPLWFGGKQMLFTVVMDVTDRKEAERELERYRRGLEDEVAERTAQLEEAYEQLESANRAKDEFLRSMSHELRTPLNSVIGFARLLEQELPGPLNEEQKTQIRMIRDAGMHLLSLVDDVLDLSRIEEGRVSAVRSEVDLGQLIREAVGAVRPMADEKGLALEVRGATSLVCSTDPQLVRQIVWNLLSNAIKYTGEGSVTVLVEDAGSAARISVADTGPGMTPEEIERAFEAFTRFRPPGDSPGTGLGLAISKRLADLLGARLLIESEQGVGSTFTLEIPR
ncbi:MAG: PAS domain S-box protein [Coriobacteriia bacterium]|nr:PAS domain S-box protein [Coriobacteriia bacterium]